MTIANCISFWLQMGQRYRPGPLVKPAFLSLTSAVYGYFRTMHCHLRTNQVGHKCLWRICLEYDPNSISPYGARVSLGTLSEPDQYLCIRPFQEVARANGTERVEGLRHSPTGRPEGGAETMWIQQNFVELEGKGGSPQMKGQKWLLALAFLGAFLAGVEAKDLLVGGVVPADAAPGSSLRPAEVAGATTQEGSPQPLYFCLLSQDPPLTLPQPHPGWIILR